MDQIDKNAGLPVNQFLDLAGRGSRALDEKDLDELRYVIRERADLLERLKRLVEPSVVRLQRAEA